MLPEDVQVALTRATILWGELEGVYDRIDDRMLGGRWASTDQEARRLDALQAELAPLVSILASARSGANAGTEIDRAWATMAARGRALAARRRDVEERVIAARDTIEAELARVRRGRSQTRSYAATATLPPRFTSRRI